MNHHADRPDDSASGQEPGPPHGGRPPQDRTPNDRLAHDRPAHYPPPHVPPHLDRPAHDRPAHERQWGPAATVALAIEQRADIVRVHDVEEMVQVARIADAVVRGVVP